jgi:4-diphosphocytidyl-2-C-methyl-D-erythritol kinase
VVVQTPAKINLHLGVGPVGPDGYHPVLTVLQAVSLFDEVVAEPAPDVTVKVLGEGARGEVPDGPENLAHRAAVLLAARAGVPAGVRLTLDKRIPVAAGMAGGSADAAGALVACDALWETGLPREELHHLAAALGSDVPFALAGGTALGTGRGEQLTPVLARGSYAWVLALASGGLSTPAVYREYDRMLEELPDSPELLVPAVPPPDDVLAALRAGDPAMLGLALGNDLQLPALRLRPALRRVLDAGRELGALGALVSGSGPTCAFLVASAEAATGIAERLAGLGLCREVLTATGPAPGARVVG